MLNSLFLIASLFIQNVEDNTHWSDPAFSNLLAEYSSKLPNALSRFRKYPPEIWFGSDETSKVFEINTNFYLKGIDFSCVSPWNDRDGRFKAGTAISKRHIIFAKHFPLSSGTKIAFVGDSGQTSCYQIQATQAVKTWDIMIGLLDRELSNDIHPAKVLPLNFSKWIVAGSKWPIVTFNQNEQVVLSQASIKWHKESKTYVLRNAPVINRNDTAFTRKIARGDSGDPAFIIFKGKPILLYCVFSSGIGDGSMIHDHLEEIQSAMDSLCPSYKLDYFDFNN